MKYLQNAKSKEVVSVPDAEVEALLSGRDSEFRAIKVVHLKAKDDNRYFVVSSDEWKRYGANEKALWDVVDSPEEREKSTLKAAFDQGLPKKGGKK